MFWKKSFLKLLFWEKCHTILRFWGPAGCNTEQSSMKLKIGVTLFNESSFTVLFVYVFNFRNILWRVADFQRVKNAKNDLGGVGEKRIHNSNPVSAIDSRLASSPRCSPDCNIGITTRNRFGPFYSRQFPFYSAQNPYGYHEFHIYLFIYRFDGKKLLNFHVTFHHIYHLRVELSSKRFLSTSFLEIYIY